ncbi:MAG: MFS transporter, partial [Myxococcota bacterium]
MSQTSHQTAPEDVIPFGLKLAYGLGAFVNNLLAGAIGGMTIVLNLGLQMSPTLVGLLGAIPRLTDALTDPLMGYISDNTRSRWGRRRPYIFAGAIAVGLIFIALWQLPRGQSENFYFWYFLIGSLIFYLAYTCFATPWVALGYELTPDYHERTRLMGVQNFVGQLAYFVSPWFLWVMQNEDFFSDLVSGAAGLAWIIGIFAIVIGILPAILLRERFETTPPLELKDINPEDPARIKSKFDTARRPSKNPLIENVKDFFRGFIATLKFRPFQKLCVATFLVFNGFILISSFQPYVIIYYVFAGDKAQGAAYA